MKDKWLKDLHDRMSEFEMDTPDNLWAEIEKAEAQRCPKPKVSIWIWMKRYSSVAAAAIVALVIGGYIFFSKDSGLNPQLTTTAYNAPEQVIQVEEHQISGESTLTSTSPLTSTKTQQTVKPLLAVIYKESLSPRPEDLQIQPIDSTKSPYAENDLPGKAVEEGKTGNDTVSLRRYQPLDYYKEDNNSYRPLIASNYSSDSRFSVGIFSSGGVNSNMSRTSVSDGLASTGPDGADWEDEPLLGILLFNQGKEITTDIKHRQPIRAGVSFTYKLTDRLGFSTGLSYTNLTSDIRSGSESHYFSGEQILHYVGIPVNVSYDIFRWKRLQLYASAGALAEKCVSGKVTTDYVLDNNTAQTETENIAKKPFQFSLNAAAGIQFNITDMIGVYAEPGVSYYFSDGTDIKTIYKDKPLNLNLNFGLRFTIRK